MGWGEGRQGEADKQYQVAERTGSVYNLMTTSAQSELGSFRRHRARFPAAPWRLIISGVLFPRSSKGFLEVICLLVPTALHYHSHLTDGKTGH